MIHSRDRILTTHVGSLPRSESLSDLLIRREAGESYDRGQFEAEMEKAVRHVVNRQKEAGIDLGNDGEQQRVGFQTYVPARMSGFAGESKRRRGREFEEFPELVRYLTHRFPHVSKQQNAPEARGELRYHDTSAITSEIKRFTRIAGEGRPFAEMFMTAPSPGIIASTMLNAYYPSQEDYLAAIAREMKNEYRAIADAGLILQIDAPDLAMDRTMFYRDQSDAQFAKTCELHVAMINRGIEGIPRERVRLHVCYGNWEGPHIHDIALEKILPALYQAKVGALSIELSNPRHAHEYAAFKRAPLPKDMILIPGVVETTSNFVEHPEVVARRIEEAVAAVGDRERVIASTDCGFGTFTRREWVIEPAVDISKDEQFKPDFLKISPNNRIPAIVDRDDNMSLMESGAILIYLADKTGKLLPKSGEARYRTIEWLMWQMGGPGPMFGQVHHFVKYNKGKAPYAEQRYLKEAHRLYSVLNKRLADREYVADQYSIADIAIWPWVSRYEWQTIDLNQYPNVKRWYVGIAKRPAVQKGYKVPKDVGEVPMP